MARDIIYDTVQEVFKQWLEQYTLDTVSEEERIKKEYYTTNYTGFTYNSGEWKEGDDISARIGALVFPVKENSKWSQYKKLSYEESQNPNGDGYYPPDYYVKLSKIDGEYKIVYIDFVPEGYQEYAEKMKEKGIDVENLNVEEILNSNYEETTEVVEQNAETLELKAENEIIEKTSMGITIFCSLMIVLSLILYVRKIVRKK